MKVFDLIPMDKFQDLMEKCSLLITHGGVGTIISGLTKDKKVIAVPRLKKYGEHVNDHQKEFCEELIKRGFPIIVVNDVEDLENVILNCGQGCGNNYASNNKNFNERVLSALNKLFE
jgi:UDP-N-acetylglucosamine transferase subunit ALG13